MKTIIIAEAGVNHNGKVDLAKKLISKAANLGADFIKFQTYKTEDIVISKSALAFYQKKNLKKLKTQFQMLKKYELKYQDFKKLINFAKTKKIKFLSSPFDIKSIKFLKHLKLEYYKIPSGEINNFLYLKTIGSLKKKIILSTGMSTLREVKDAVKILVKYGTKKRDITILHCHSAYPSQPFDLNLKAIQTLKKKLKLNVGYSDHSDDIYAPIVAVSLGAKIIEKHLTLDKKMAGPDHRASITPLQFKKMVNLIKLTEIMLGSEKKVPTKNELINRKFVRKSLVAKIDIKKGEKFSVKNISIKRPGTGINPMKVEKYLKKKAKKNYFKDDFII
jgi:N,N'-diacetyllegionaminate synthase